MGETWNVIFPNQNGKFHHSFASVVTPSCKTATEAMEVAASMVAATLGIPREFHSGVDMKWLPILHGTDGRIWAYKAVNFEVVVACNKVGN